MSSGLVVIELEGNARPREPLRSGFHTTRHQAERVGKRVPSAFASRRTRQPRPILNRMAANPHSEWWPHFIRSRIYTPYRNGLVTKR